jgi:hypothetical protein
MLLIATDEAGYGPKLGPLVIAATVWRLPGEEFLSSAELDERFAPLRRPYRCAGRSIFVADSKAMYTPSAGLETLHAVVSASVHWCQGPERTLVQWLARVASEDREAIARAPWLAEIEQVDFLGPDATADLLQHWKQGGTTLADVKARIVTAEAFNQLCVDCGNKADLLSSATLRLVRELIHRHGAGERSAAVFCDRHGGRRYYAGVLQHVFPDAGLRPISEAKVHSEYRLSCQGLEIDVHFTVKGDSFTPVALSSLHAKYLRERLMQGLNRYFAARHVGTPGLRPTAGYPVDADRFLAEIEPILARERIERHRLVRSR